MLHLLLVVAALALIAVIALAGKLYSHRFKLHVRIDHTPDMDRLSVEGYASKYAYRAGEPISLHVSSESQIVEVTLTDASGAMISLQQINAEDRAVTDNASAIGCAWPEDILLETHAEMRQGYLDCKLSNDRSEFHFPILISSRRTDHDVVVLAPVSTWTAYNPWGGRSLYQNARGDGNVYRVTSQRPNTAFRLNHKLAIERNIFEWFDREYDAQLLPDHALERCEGFEWDCLRNAKVIVLNYHCEYISAPMYEGIEMLVKGGASVVVAGANNFWWRVRWDEQHHIMECHKDVSEFREPWAMGGRWQHNLKFSEQLFGVSFDATAIGEHFAFEVTSPSHWAFAGTDVKVGSVFGQTGILGEPICSIEFDRPTALSRSTTVLAHAKADRELPKDQGALAIREITPTQGVLSFGSVETGAGLGIDPVLTQVVKNVMQRYLA